ncbi:hypothetical protein PZB74_06660 [Porifericola rhodea]|uniref:hypothetical protein n=1 Tax=Porifericola rhodea TaxID=930972 RepID=UPI002666CA29|nr:hypothetical protein [Porifericola rhodea]WKN33024.1 hypothetical protein PZB74_06660 [Porifericola rhodea]
MSRKRLSKREKPKVNNELDGFDIKIDSFGEIRSTLEIDKINKFLNRHVDDKKLRDRDDIDKGQEDVDNKNSSQEDKQ